MVAKLQQWVLWNVMRNFHICKKDSLDKFKYQKALLYVKELFVHLDQ